MRAGEQGTRLDLARAMGEMVPSPFEWQRMARDKTVFVVWSTGAGKKLDYHLTATSLPYLAGKIAKQA